MAAVTAVAVTIALMITGKRICHSIASESESEGERINPGWMQ